MKELGTAMDFWSQTITLDVITLPMRTSTPLQDASRLRLQKLNDSWAKEPIRTQAKSAT